MSASAPVQRGDLLAGKYRIERLLGEGAMGVVVAATHLDLDKPVALKFMKPEAIAAPECIDRFLREARAAGRLRSEHTCQVHDVGRLDNGAPYIVMELLEGEDLQTFVDRVGVLPSDLVARYLGEVCEAMEEAHAAGIVHRDLKPQNLFKVTTPGGRDLIKVLDFGVSKLHQGDGATRTANGAIIGTPAFMSPEQMVSSKDVDRRSDIWAMGVIMYQLATGCLPFAGDDVFAIGLRIVNDAPVPPRAIRPDLDARLEVHILRCLAKDPAARYATAEELRRDLLVLVHAGDRSRVSAAFAAPAGLAGWAQATISLNSSAEMPAMARSTLPQLAGTMPPPATGARTRSRVAIAAAAALATVIGGAGLYYSAASPTRRAALERAEAVPGTGGAAPKGEAFAPVTAPPAVVVSPRSAGVPPATAMPVDAAAAAPPVEPPVVEAAAMDAPPTRDASPPVKRPHRSRNERADGTTGTPTTTTAPPFPTDEELFDRRVRSTDPVQERTRTVPR